MGQFHFMTEPTGGGVLRGGQRHTAITTQKIIGG